MPYSAIPSPSATKIDHALTKGLGVLGQSADSGRCAGGNSNAGADARKAGGKGGGDEADAVGRGGGSGSAGTKDGRKGGDGNQNGDKAKEQTCGFVNGTVHNSILQT